MTNERGPNSIERGFTLVELLIVIVILGILAAVAVFAVGGVTDKGKQSACKADVNSTETALEAYYAKVGSYPAANAWASITSGANKFLKNQPSTANYTITFDANGVVTAAPLCSTL